MEVVPRGRDLQRLELAPLASVVVVRGVVDDDGPGAELARELLREQLGRRRVPGGVVDVDELGARGQRGSPHCACGGV